MELQQALLEKIPRGIALCGCMRRLSAAGVRKLRFEADARMAIEENAVGYRGKHAALV
jgi:hypothetical protein